MKVRWWLLGVVAATVAWFAFGSERAPALPDAPPPAAAATTGTGTGAGATADDGSHREAAPATPADTAPPAAAAAATAPFDPAPAAVTPWLARFVVTDADDSPVPDAEITIWAALRLDARTAQQGHAEQPLLQLRTDAAGRTQTMLALEACYVAARKDGLGRSAEVMLRRTPVDREITIVIEQPIVLRGVVLRADGTPAPGAQVVATDNRIGTRTSASATADADGRFAIDVRFRSSCALEAQLGGERTMLDIVAVRSREPPPVTLRFPGAITIAGFVVDADGSAVAGARLRGWRERGPGEARDDPDAGERIGGVTGADGRFSIPLREHARYQLVASKKGQTNSAPTRVETSDVRPHAEVRLQLSRATRIAGRVVHADGAPLAGARVGARPAQGEGSLVGTSLLTEMFGEVASEITDGDGRFVLSVAPTTRWDLCVQPVADNWRLQTWRRSVAPGDDSVEMRITSEDIAGCVVHGVVERTDGGPLPDYDVDILDFEAGDASINGPTSAAIDGAQFTLPPLPHGGQYILRVRAKGTGALAPARIGPFTTDQAELLLTFRLQPWGNVSVRVLAADGTPARGVRVRLQASSLSLNVDIDGCASFGRYPPGPARLKVFDRTSQLCEQEVLITPGLNPEITIRLPAAQPR
jgi:protocatechuate 3,4-dioxygenase beta subunit